MAINNNLLHAPEYQTCSNIQPWYSLLKISSILSHQALFVFLRVVRPWIRRHIQVSHPPGTRQGNII